MEFDPFPGLPGLVEIFTFGLMALREKSPIPGSGVGVGVALGSGVGVGVGLGSGVGTGQSG